MKAIVALLKSLPLQPENVESDITEAKSSLFLKYVVFGQFLFNFFQCFCSYLEISGIGRGVS